MLWRMASAFWWIERGCLVVFWRWLQCRNCLVTTLASWPSKQFAHSIEISTVGLHEEFCFPFECLKVSPRGVIHVIVGDFQTRLQAEKFAFQNLLEWTCHPFLS
jgi:hypothetical protein